MAPIAQATGKAGNAVADTSGLRKTREIQAAGGRRPHMGALTAAGSLDARTKGGAMRRTLTAAPLHFGIGRTDLTIDHLDERQILPISIPSPEHPRICE